MNEITTERLTLRAYMPSDAAAMYELLSDETVNRFLPWFPVKSVDEADAFCRERYNGDFSYLICLEGRPAGYVKLEKSGSHDLGYAVRRELWRQGIASEAASALLFAAKDAGIPFVTATHDRENPASGGVMRKIGMKYRYSYEEFWRPKNYPVIFRMYQLNFSAPEDFVYPEYRERYPSFTEKNL